MDVATWLNTGKMISPHPCLQKSLVHADKTSPANRIVFDSFYQCDLIIFTQVATPSILHKSNIPIIMLLYILGKLANFIFAISSDHLGIRQINIFWRFKNIEGWIIDYAENIIRRKCTVGLGILDIFKSKIVDARTEEIKTWKDLIGYIHSKFLLKLMNKLSFESNL